MSRRNIITAILILGAFGVGSLVGVLGYSWSTGGLTEESAPIENIAPTLSLDNPTPTPGSDLQLATQIAQINSNLESIAVQVETLSDDSAAIHEQLDAIGTLIAGAGVSASDTAPQVTPDPTEEPTPEPTEEVVVQPTRAVGAADVPERALYRISGEDSEVRFLIDEVLAGNPTTVTATTRRVAGDVIVNFAAPSASQVGTIAINARTFRTDNEFRDNSIRGQILETNTHEFINFVPIQLNGLPTEPVGVGSMVEFEIVGDLTIKDVTRSVTFNATVTVVSEDRIEGLARTQVLYKDYGITIRTPPLVSDVSDEVILEIEFVALKVDE